MMPICAVAIDELVVLRFRNWASYIPRRFDPFLSHNFDIRNCLFKSCAISLTSCKFWHLSNERVIVLAPVNNYLILAHLNKPPRATYHLLQPRGTTARLDRDKRNRATLRAPLAAT